MQEAFRILTWNVNSVRARLDLILEYLEDKNPEVVCLQETKVQNNLFPRVPFMEMGYEVELHGSKGYAGVATLSRSKYDRVQSGFATEPKDRHCRILAVDLGKTRIYNLYAPNGTALDSDNYPYKLQWYAQLRREVQALFEQEQSVILCGDFNIIPDDRDVWDPKAWEGSLQCSAPEREALQDLKGTELQDCFRRLSDEAGVYSYFDYQRQAWPRRHGIRIDHFYATQDLAQRCHQVEHDLEARGWEGTSDHVPVIAHFSAALDG